MAKRVVFSQEHSALGDIQNYFNMSTKAKASLENDIMKVWKAHNRDDKKRMDVLGQMMKYRHWLAHGRYWHYHEKIDNYSKIEKLATNIFDNMGLFEE